jgi:tetraacyldisaccharide 4'-kinase
MCAQSLYHRIVSGRAGAWATPLRGVLRGLEVVYAKGVDVRNRRYDREGASTILPIPIISVGNITVGGTGKTPFVIDLVQRLERMGFSPAVVARGYKAVNDEPNDEQRLIQKHCPQVVVLSNPDRIAAGEIAYRKCGADVIVLDDGFQHRRLGRVLDIVLVDATMPFGYDHLLPRGLLREPVKSLKRAQVVVISRADQASRAALERIDKRVRAAANEATHLKCNHRVTDVEHISGTVMTETLEGKRAVLFAGVGNPAAFRVTAASLGVEVVGEKWWPDHHAYRRRDVDALLRVGRFAPHDLLLTTEKDAVKLAALGGLEHANIFTVRVVIDFADDGDRMLQDVLDGVLLTSRRR